jgi:hypothetical protein
MTQGAPHGNALDLDALLASKSLQPQPVKLGGHTYNVRTDLTGAEITKYFALANSGKDVEGLTMLVGKDAKKLDTFLNSLPQKHMVMAVNELMAIAGVVNGVSHAQPEGESQAS